MNTYLLNAANAMKKYCELIEICKDVCKENKELTKEFLRFTEEEIIDVSTATIPEFVFTIVNDYKKYYMDNDVDKDELYITAAYYIKEQVKLNKELE